MPYKIEISIPFELYQEIEAYSRSEGLTVSEFGLWAISEKVGELRQRRGVKNLQSLFMLSKPESQRAETDENKSAGKETSMLLRAEEAADRLNVSKGKIYQLLQRGDLPSIHIGKAVRVREEDLETFLKMSRKGD